MAQLTRGHLVGFNFWMILNVILLAEEGLSQTVHSTIHMNSTLSSINISPTTSLKPHLISSLPSHSVNKSMIKPSSALLTIVPSSLNNATFNVSPCVKKEKWKNEMYEDLLLCLTQDCAYKAFKEFDTFMRCNSREIEMDMLVIGGYIAKYGVKRAEKMIPPLGSDPIKRTFESQMKRDFYVEYGFIRSRFLKRSVSVPFPYKNLNDGGGYEMPPTLMNKKVHAYAYVEFTPNIYKPNQAIDYKADNNALSRALYLLNGGKVDDPLVPPTTANIFNSKIITVLTNPVVESFKEYVDIHFTLRDPKGTINHKCVHAPGHLGRVMWTNQGCYTLSSTVTTVNCRCTSSTSNFAILSELFIPPAAKTQINDEKFAVALVVICAVGVLVCFLCLILPPCIGCSYVGGMIRIYRYSDLTQAVEYIILIIGVYASRHEMASALIAVVLHFLHCSVMFWALIEGIYLYHKVKPQFHRTTGTMFFYSTMVFGISAALTGAAAGYDFNFGPDIQYVWVKANGSELVYLLIPIIVMIICSVSIVWILIMQQKNWIGFQDDYVYSRTPYFVRRQSTFVLVCVITFISGAMSMKGIKIGFMAALFAAFLVLQFVCRFYSHFIWNYEVWEWKKFNDAYEYNETAKLDDRFKHQARENAKKTQHTTLLIGASSSSSNSSSSDDDGDDDDIGVEVNRVHQRPTSVVTVSSTTSQEIAERTVTPGDQLTSKIAMKQSRPIPTAPIVDTIPDMMKEEKEDKKDRVSDKTWKERKPSIQPRMTRAAAMRRQSTVTQSLLDQTEDAFQL